jgi:hypothetical protein
MWLGRVFAKTLHYGICICSLTRMVRLRPRQYVQYGIRILSVRTTKAVDKVKVAVTLSTTRSVKRQPVSWNIWDRGFR